MKRYLPDTNCLLSYFTERNLQQQKAISDHFQAASQLQESMIIHSHVISETVFVLLKVYRTRPETVRKILVSIRENPGFVLDDSFFHEMALELWPGHIKDFGDAILAAYSKTMRIPILTFDRKFAGSLTKLKIPSGLLST